MAYAGYKLFSPVMTPFSKFFGMPDDTSHYNLVHSRTRIVVEQAFGRWKNVFRVFKTDLLHRTPQEMARVIEATLVLHNWFIDFKLSAEDLELPEQYEDWMHVGGDITLPDLTGLIDGDEAMACRNRIKNYLNDYVVV